MLCSSASAALLATLSSSALCAESAACCTRRCSSALLLASASTASLAKSDLCNMSAGTVAANDFIGEPSIEASWYECPERITAWRTRCMTSFASGGIFSNSKVHERLSEDLLKLKALIRGEADLVLLP
jgi:hypothetical protein